MRCPSRRQRDAPLDEAWSSSTVSGALRVAQADPFASNGLFRSFHPATKTGPSTSLSRQQRPYPHGWCAIRLHVPERTLAFVGWKPTQAD